MSASDSLGDRMKTYERVTRTVLPRRTYTILRVDGRAFHTYLRGAARPFDFDFMRLMDRTAEALCAEVTGTVFAYTQSDEISLLICDFASLGTEPWFGGEVQKIVSIAAATASVTLTRVSSVAGPPATFDARVFTITDPYEVANYFVWRQRDAVRNSITMAAQSQFSQRELHRVNTAQMQEMLWSQKQINWNDYPDGAKRGRVVVRAHGAQEVTFTDKRTGQQRTITPERSWWETRSAPHLTADNLLDGLVPLLPGLRMHDES